MMPNAMKQLGQQSPFFRKLHKLLPANKSITILINEGNDAVNGFMLYSLVDVLGRLVFEAVGRVEVVVVPRAAVVKVVEREEGAGVEVGDVVFL